MFLYWKADSNMVLPSKVKVVPNPEDYFIGEVHNQDDLNELCLTLKKIEDTRKPLIIEALWDVIFFQVLKEYIDLNLVYNKQEHVAV